MVTLALHTTGGLILMGLVVWQPLTAGPMAFIFGWLREQSYEWGQTRERIKRKINEGIPFMKPTFLDTWWHWQTWHKNKEALQWGLGGLIASIIGEFVL